jgi:hypothetical protein
MTYQKILNNLAAYNRTYKKCGPWALAFAKAVAPAKDSYFRFANV